MGPLERDAITKSTPGRSLPRVLMAAGVLHRKSGCSDQHMPGVSGGGLKATSVELHRLNETMGSPSAHAASAKPAWEVDRKPHVGMIIVWDGSPCEQEGNRTEFTAETQTDADTVARHARCR